MKRANLSKAVFAFCLFSGSITAMDALLDYELIPDIDPQLYDRPSTPRPPSSASSSFLSFVTRQCPPDTTPSEIATAASLLENDVYVHTNQPNCRSILDYPAFYFPYCLPQSRFYAGQLWYNQTPKMAYADDVYTLRGYLAFDNRNLINQIDTLASLAANLNIPRIFSLLGDIEIEDRRGVIMGWWARQMGPWLVQWKTPLAYVERNFQLDEQEKAQLEQEFTLFAIDNDLPTNPASTTQKEQEEAFDNFSQKHLISDQWGFGDSRFTAGYTFIDDAYGWLNAGFLATIPTAYTLGQGFKGSHFKKTNLHPPFDLLAILNSVFVDPAQAQELVTEFLLGALDHLSANLIEAPLGNNGHVGLGFCLDGRLNITPRFRFDVHSEFEYLLPSMEKRMYLLTKNKEDFINLNPDLVDCDEDLLFLQQQLIDTLYPPYFQTLVFPGVLLKLSLAGDIRMTRQTNLSIGYDLWFQQQENLGRLSAPIDQLKLIRKDIATKPFAYQNKIFAAITYEHQGKHGDWCISLTADQTFIHVGIGQDVSASFRLAYLF